MGGENSCIPNSLMRQSTPFESLRPTFHRRARPVSIKNLPSKKNYSKLLESPEILGYMEYGELRDFVGHPLIMFALEEKERVFRRLEELHIGKEFTVNDDPIMRNFKKSRTKNFDLTHTSRGSGETQNTQMQKIKSHEGSSRHIKTATKVSGFGLKSRRIEMISKGYKSNTMMDLPSSGSKDLLDARGSKINPFVLGSEVMEESVESTQMQTFHSKMKKRRRNQEISEFKNTIHKKLNMVSEEQGLIELFKELSKKKKIPCVLKTGGM